MNKLRSKIIGTVFDEVTISGRKIKLDPNNPHHRSIAAGLEAAEIRTHHPEMVNFLHCQDWTIGM